LSFVVDEFSGVLHPREFGALQGKSQGEEDRLEDVGLPRSVLSSQGVELRIEVLEHRLVGVGLEPFYNQLFDFHYKILIKTNWIVNSFDRSNSDCLTDSINQINNKKLNIKTKKYKLKMQKQN
jgi:hypothetical protein